MRQGWIGLLLGVVLGCKDPKIHRDPTLESLPVGVASSPPAITASAPVPTPEPSCALSSTPGSLCSPLELPKPEETPTPLPHDDGHGPSVGACPEEMVLIHGDACETAIQECLVWMDTELPLEARKRCARFAPSKCRGGQKHMRFCIDRLEMAKSPEDLPLNDLSWTVAKEQCEAQEKRLCYDPEWTFACEGEEMSPYPYGFERDAKRCNHDRTDLLEKNRMKDNRHPANAHPECVSPFGVQNMVGNVDEWVILEKGYPPMRSGLKGGWWLAGRNRCRPTTGGHDEYYHDTQTGFRCCKDAK